MASEFTYLFFDDQRLFGRGGLVRDYTAPEPVATYEDPAFSIDYGFGHAFRLSDGRVRLLYHGQKPDGTEANFAAISDDGLHFAPEDTTGVLQLKDRIAPHEFLPAVPGEEIANIFDDPYAPASQRYKMLHTLLHHDRLFVEGRVFTSPDLLHWTRLESDGMWNNGCEPITGTFYNQHHRCYTIIRRPSWGERRVGVSETHDFQHFSPLELALQTDSLDAPLDEFYGMPSFAYAGMYIGFADIFTNNVSSRSAKFCPGAIYPQLCYSFDGRHWQRSLRKSFLKEYHGQDAMFWCTSLVTEASGDLLLYVVESKQAHGYGFTAAQGGRVDIYRIKKDRFIALQTENGGTGVLTTRQLVWNGGPLKVNLRAATATVALLDEAGRPIPGFDHQDCSLFSGDDTAWVPTFRGGSTDQLIGRVIVAEVRLTDGAVWSLRGDCMPLMNTAAQRYLKFGPEHIFFDPAFDLEDKQNG